MWWLNFPIVVSVSPNVVAEFPNVVHIVVSVSPNVVAEFPNVVPIVVSGSPNVVAEFPNVVPRGVSGSPNAVAEFPNVVPIVVSGSPNATGSRDHPRTQIQITCKRRDLFLALRSSAHAADNHMYTQVSPTITCTRK